MADDLVIQLDNEDFEDAAEVHEYLAEVLQFPSYYGHNLDALNDCLGDVSRPVRIEAVRHREAVAWFEKMCQVIDRAALENPFLEFARIVAYAPDEFEGDLARLDE